MFQYPFPFKPRPNQEELLTKLLQDDQIKTAVLRIHRRWGKDAVCFFVMCYRAMKKAGNYAYFFPTLKQGVEVLWEMVDDHGNYIIDTFPEELGVKLNRSKYTITLPTEDGKKAKIYLKGLDTIGDKNRGIAVDGAVFSEYSFADINSIKKVLPAIRGKKGWIIYNSTPQGKDHFWKMEQLALDRIQKGSKDWLFMHRQTLDPNAENYSGVFSVEEIEAIKRTDGYSQSQLEQEYGANYDSGEGGTVFGKQLAEMRKEGRIGDFSYDNTLPVYAYLDLGYHDDTSICFVQYSGSACRIIDFWRGNNMNIPEIVRVAFADSNYKDNLLGVYLPHDATQNYGLNYTKEDLFQESLQNYNINAIIEVSSRMRVQQSISFTREYFRKFQINLSTCDYLLESLEQYSYKFQGNKGIYDDANLKPIHNKYSHAVDALRLIAQHNMQVGEPNAYQYTPINQNDWGDFEW
jgi:phage terminase large subunit